MIGRELNPRIGNFDIKFFTELRPGLIMWLLLNICFAVCQWVELGRVTYSMILVNVFQGWYILDALINESSVLTTMDITTDGFGFMLAFGNLSWVPMMYSLQARYLCDYPVDLSIPHLAGIIALQCLLQIKCYRTFIEGLTRKHSAYSCTSLQSTNNIFTPTRRRGEGFVSKKCTRVSPTCARSAPYRQYQYHRVDPAAQSATHFLRWSRDHHTKGCEVRHANT